MEVTKITKKRIVEYLSKGKRFDGRGLLDYRPITIEFNASKKADGSARVRIGGTEVLAGVKMNVAEPYPDSEDSGVMTVTAELSPLANEIFELGPPRINSIELARIVDRGIRESKFIDFKKLCIKKGEKVWMVFIDIYPVNDDGNLFDASALAVAAALQNARMPKYDEKEEKVEFGNLTNKKLPLGESMPITLTLHKIGQDFILDPSSEEEESSDARLSMAISPDNKKEPVINAMQKGYETSLTKEETFKMIDMAIKEWKRIYPEVLEKLKKADKISEE